ncbi:uncharacterized protein Tco025E_10077 [Trypanosoma conorhini]|uniref:Uncharacterized protein n=1 Tax=Trypanosoma conorhini TaxID=83891 RepID=A0A422MQ42_9TRYP|nr:uncharacterized protein Tco025E_10077 [Trypanosoma conorhini]RNE95336.1 hypothetical protein Tco025E_10077 [Trypanosoma conorhini]
MRKKAVKKREALQNVKQRLSTAAARQPSCSPLPAPRPSPGPSRPRAKGKRKGQRRRRAVATPTSALRSPAVLPLLLEVGRGELHQFPPQVAVGQPAVRPESRMRRMPKTPQGPMPLAHLQRARPKHLQRGPSLPAQMTPRRRLAVTAAPRPRTPLPSLRCFFCLRMRLPLRWWPREWQCERSVHTSLPSSSICVSPCTDSLALASPHEAHTHTQCVLVYIHISTHAAPSVFFCTRRAAAVLLGCMGTAP